MKLKVIVHEAEEGGFWAEVPSIAGCATQGDTFEELLANLYEAVEACLSIDLEEIQRSKKDKVMEIAVWNKFQEKSLQNCLKSMSGNYLESKGAIMYI